MTQCLCLLLLVIFLGGCEIIRVQLKSPITTSVMLEPGSLDPLENELSAINASITGVAQDIKTFVTWLGGGGGVAAFLGLSGGGGYIYMRKRKKNGDGG